MNFDRLAIRHKYSEIEIESAQGSGNMVNYWLCVTTEPNWKVVKKSKIWGVSEHNSKKIKCVEEGDPLVFYVIPKKIKGILKATEKAFTSDTTIFVSKGPKKDETFPYRIRLQPVTIPKTPLAIEDVIPKLTFVIGKRMWEGYFRRAMQTIPEEDFTYIKCRLETRE